MFEKTKVFHKQFFKNLYSFLSKKLENFFFMPSLFTRQFLVHRQPQLRAASTLDHLFLDHLQMAICYWGTNPSYFECYSLINYIGNKAMQLQI